MKATLVGYRPVDFTDDETGRSVKGNSLYITYDDQSDQLVGEIACRVFYPGKISHDWVGQIVDLDYVFNPSTKKAKLVNVQLA